MFTEKINHFIDNFLYFCICLINIMKLKTKTIHSAYQSKDAYGALAMPVYHTAAYEFENAEIMSDAFCSRVAMPDYSRVTNPTVIYFEKRVKEITGANTVYALTSGMAAISNALLSISQSGDNIVTSNHLFGNTWLLMSKTFARLGIEARFCNLCNPEEVKSAIDERTCCVYAEIISNPLQEVADLQALAEIVHSKGKLLLADTTMIPFTRFSAKELGVDLELVSSTKYVSGGASTIGGLVIDYSCGSAFNERMQEMMLNLGAYMTPHVAYMQTLGLENLEARYALESANTMELAGRLCTLPAIKYVNYTGLEGNPYHKIASRQFNNTYGAMICIELESPEACFRFLNNLKLIKRATNLFDNRTLAIHPASTIFGNFSKQELKAMDISETCIRLSVGLEDVDDLFEDISQALK